MEITKSPVEWDEVEDREILAQFLRTRTGQRLLPKVVESAPLLLAGGEINSILIRSGELRGFQAALNTLLALSEIEQKVSDGNPIAGAYPRLSDDSAWEDGKKLTG